MFGISAPARLPRAAASASSAPPSSEPAAGLGRPWGGGTPKVSRAEKPRPAPFGTSSASKGKWSPALPAQRGLQVSSASSHPHAPPQAPVAPAPGLGPWIREALDGWAEQTPNRSQPLPVPGLAGGRGHGEPRLWGRGHRGSPHPIPLRGHRDQAAGSRIRCRRLWVWRLMRVVAGFFFFFNWVPTPFLTLSNSLGRGDPLLAEGGKCQGRETI